MEGAATYRVGRYYAGGRRRDWRRLPWGATRGSKCSLDGGEVYLSALREAQEAP